MCGGAGDGDGGCNGWFCISSLSCVMPSGSTVFFYCFVLVMKLPDFMLFSGDSAFFLCEVID